NGGFGECFRDEQHGGFDLQLWTGLNGEATCSHPMAADHCANLAREGRIRGMFDRMISFSRKARGMPSRCRKRSNRKAPSATAYTKVTGAGAISRRISI